MNQLSQIQFERQEIVRALRALCALDVKVLLELAVRAHPATGRVWEMKARLAEDLTMTDHFFDEILERLAEESFVEALDPAGQRLGWIELGEVLVRQGQSPDNLPVERAT